MSITCLAENTGGGGGGGGGSSDLFAHEDMLRRMKGRPPLDVPVHLSVSGRLRFDDSVEGQVKAKILHNEATLTHEEKRCVRAVGVIAYCRAVRKWIWIGARPSRETASVAMVRRLLVLSDDDPEAFSDCEHPDDGGLFRGGEKRYWNYEVDEAKHLHAILVVGGGGGGGGEEAPSLLLSPPTQKKPSSDVGVKNKRLCVASWQVDCRLEAVAPISCSPLWMMRYFRTARVGRENPAVILAEGGRKYLRVHSCLLPEKEALQARFDAMRERLLLPTSNESTTSTTTHNNLMGFWFLTHWVVLSGVGADVTAATISDRDDSKVFESFQALRSSFFDDRAETSRRLPPRLHAKPSREEPPEVRQLSLSWRWEGRLPEGLALFLKAQRLDHRSSSAYDDNNLEVDFRSSEDLQCAKAIDCYLSSVV